MVNKSRIINGMTMAVSLIVLIVLLLIMIYPIALVAFNAIKTETEFIHSGPLSLPQGVYLDNIINYWKRPEVDFTRKLVNSTVISLGVALLATGLSLLNAFALGIGRIKGSVWILVLFMVAFMLPHESLAYPLYYLAKLVKLYDTQLAVILIFSAIQSVFGTYLLTSVFSVFPKELIEAAMIDGCNKIRLLISVVAPISIPTLSVLFVFFFIWTWNEFFLPMIFLISNAKQTVPLAIALNQSQYQMDYTTQAASAFLGVLPCILFFVIFQRTLTKGITAGSIK